MKSYAHNHGNDVDDDDDYGNSTAAMGNQKRHLTRGSKFEARRNNTNTSNNVNDRKSSSTIAEICQLGLYDHNMLIYPDLSTFRKIYSECAKQALENNEIVLLITTYDSFDKVINSLTQAGVSVNDETRDGNLMVLDSIKAYQIDTYGVIKYVKTLDERLSRERKAGIFNISDIGSFFVAERIPTLVEYEQNLTKKFDIPLKAFCSYHIDDFVSLSHDQQERILSAHNHVIDNNNNSRNYSQP
jgi:hypothetical protein